VDVPPSGQIIVDFAPVIDPVSIIKEEGIKILQMKNKNEVEGTWKASHNGTRYTFIPVKDLTKNEQYTIGISAAVKDMRGIHLEKGKAVHFTVASE
jgi:hypothetical protein